MTFPVNCTIVDNIRFHLQLRCPFVKLYPNAGQPVRTVLQRKKHKRLSYLFWLVILPWFYKFQKPLDFIWIWFRLVRVRSSHLLYSSSLCGEFGLYSLQLLPSPAEVKRKALVGKIGRGTDCYPPKGTHDLAVVQDSKSQYCWLSSLLSPWKWKSFCQGTAPAIRNKAETFWLLEFKPLA